MKKIAILLTLLFLLIIESCATSSGKRIIHKNEVEAELSIGGAFFYYTSLPLPLPNLGLGIRYGVHEKINLGIRAFPLLLTFNTFQTTPYTVFSILENSNSIIPSLNAYGEINFVIYLGKPELIFFPLAGLCSIWKLSSLNIYLPIEVSLDIYSQRRPVKFNIGIGSEFRIIENLNVSLELRLNSIGNIYLPLSTTVGIPVLLISTSYKF